MKKTELKKEIKPRVNKGTLILSVALIVILGFAVYGNSLNGKFLLDDEFFVWDNIYIKSWSNVLNLFIQDIGTGTAQEFGFYRPILRITYAADYSIWRLNVIGYHLTNTILHIFVALCIYWLIMTLYKDRLLSLLTAILFVVHPIQTEAVAYISGRADPLALLFMLLCLILYIKSRLYPLMILCYIFALLSRESSLILPVLILFYHYAFKKKLDIKKYLPILAITFIYILLRLTVLSHLLPGTASPVTLLERLPGFFVAITNYLRLLFLPFGLHMEYGVNLFSLFDPKAAIGAVILFSLLSYAFVKRRVNNLFFFSVFWFFITLLPSSNLYPINAYMAEHWLYAPSIGFFLVLAQRFSSMYRTKELKTFTVVLMVGLLTFYSYLTVRQNEYWWEPIAFYERTLRYEPKSSRTYNNLGLIYSNIGKKEEAITLYKKAIEINPNNVKAYSNLGVAYNAVGKNKEAIALYEKMIEIKLSRAYAYNNLGLVYISMGRKEEAMASLKKAIEINPSFQEGYNNLGNIYLGLSKNDEAIALYKKAIEINPNNVTAYNNLGKTFVAIGKLEEAMAAFKKAVEINPDDAETYNNLGKTYLAIGKIGGAIASYKRALKINPNNAMVHNNLAAAYYYNKQYDSAIKHYDIAIGLGYKVHPEFSESLKPHRK